MARCATHCDLKAFFDTVNHERLMAQLRGKVRDGKVLALIRRYLSAGVMLPDGTLEATPQGVPQGGPLSPLLANIVLDPLDKELERRAHRFARYADDFIVMVRSPRAAERVKASLTRFAEERLKLVINRTKSKAAPLQTCALPSPSAPPCGLPFGQAVSLRSAPGFPDWQARPGGVDAKGPGTLQTAGASAEAKRDRLPKAAPQG